GIFKKLEAFADGVLVRPDLFCCRLIDNGHSWTVFTHRPVKSLASQKRDSHGSEIVGGDGPKLRDFAILAVGGVLAFAEKSTAKSAIEQRDYVCDGGLLHAGQRLNCFQCTPFELLCPGSAIIQRAQIKAQHAQVLRVEAWIELLRIAQADEKQPGSDQSNKADCHL